MATSRSKRKPKSTQTLLQSKTRARKILTRVKKRTQRYAKSQQKVPKAKGAVAKAVRPGLLIAEGDSWFDYPGTDVLAELEDNFGYEVRSAAHKGDTVESMAYGANQLDKLARIFLKAKNEGRVPRAILLSGGGNDIAGDEFPLLLNHADSGLPTLNEDVVRGLIDVRLSAALVRLAQTVTDLCNATFHPTTPVPVLVHGYDYPVPDGRGYWGGWGPLPGPWLEPGFKQKGYASLSANTEIMQTLIQRFNKMLASLPKAPGLGHVKYVNLRGTLSNKLAGGAYKTWWDNELHPEDRGYTAVAARFHRAIP